MRINLFLSKAGLGSRRKVEELILNKKICVNGNNNIPLYYNVDLDKDIVSYNGEIVKIINEKYYIMLNKPKMYITSISDDRGRKTVIDLLKNNKLFSGIYPVGRLDYNTEGLLLLTNDGEFCNKVTHPANKIGKTYLVTLNKNVKPHDLVALRKGVVIDDSFKTSPANVSNPIVNEDKIQVKIEIFEGKNRQVRKMFDTLGYKVLELKRIAIGKLELGELKSGKYKLLSKNELDKIFK